MWAIMSSPRLVPFEAHHLRGLLNRDSSYQDSEAQARIKATFGIAWTALHEERILGCAGIVLQWPGMASAWMVVSEDIGRYAVWLTRTVKRFLRDAIRAYKLHRIEAVVIVGNVRNQRWIERLGFTSEGGCARRYTPDGQDVIRYEWIGGQA